MMSSFTSRAFRTILEPVLKKHGIDLPRSAATPPKTSGATKPDVKKAQQNHDEDGMGALLRFLVINAVSVIGAKLVSEAAERISQKLFNNRQGHVANDPQHPDAPTLETRICPKCGAFRIRGEQCACGAQ